MPNERTGKSLLKLAKRHIGEQYILGALAPKNNANWKGPWDCAEFASWLVYQVSGVLYGCNDDAGNPASADAWTGFWDRDAKSSGRIVSIDEAARTPGAAVLRVPQQGAIGHVVLSDGRGGTVEAHSSKRGVIAGTLSQRRWDYGILVPGIEYAALEAPVTVAEPKGTIFRLQDPPMQGEEVKKIQRALKSAGFDPGIIDSVFGPKTHAAVVAFQVAKGLVPDGEVGLATRKALKLG